MNYKCLLCGYIYDPEKGDPDSGSPFLLLAKYVS